MADNEPLISPVEKTARDRPPIVRPEPEKRPFLHAPIILGEMTMASAETQTTVGAAGGATALPATPTGYLRMMMGTTEVVIPYYAQS